jgi:hypothetical protein
VIDLTEPIPLTELPTNIFIFGSEQEPPNAQMGFQFLATHEFGGNTNKQEPCHQTIWRRKKRLEEKERLQRLHIQPSKTRARSRVVTQTEEQGIAKWPCSIKKWPELKVAILRSG